VNKKKQPYIPLCDLGANTLAQVFVHSDAWWKSIERLIGRLSTMQSEPKGVKDLSACPAAPS
jgi:hypothetical protein